MTDIEHKTFQTNTNFHKFFTKLSTSAHTREIFIQSIVSTGYGHCYLEFPPITKESINSKDDAEYTVIEASDFKDANWKIFYDKLKPYLKNNQSHDPKIETTYFPNISGDTMLVVPIPTINPEIDRYSGDLMNFLKYGQKSQQHAVINLVAQTVLTTIETRKKVFISTHGHGVPWLHVRLSDTPKYYTHKKYVK